MDDDKLNEILQTVIYLKTRDLEHTKKDDRFIDQWHELINMVRSNAENIQHLNSVSFKIDTLVEQIKSHSREITSLNEHKIRSEPLSARVQKIEDRQEIFIRYRWMFLGAAAVIGLLASLVQPLAFQFLN